MRFALLLFTISPVVFSSPYHDYSVDLTPSEELINGGSQVISSIPPRTDPESDAGTTGTVDSTGRDSTPSQDNVQPPDPGGLGGDPKIHVPGVYPFKAAPPCRRGDPAICKGKPFGSHLRSECFYCKFCLLVYWLSLYVFLCLQKSSH